MSHIELKYIYYVSIWVTVTLTKENTIKKERRNNKKKRRKNHEYANAKAPAELLSHLPVKVQGQKRIAYTIIHEIDTNNIKTWNR